jgi:hypothetical protein
MSPAVGEQVHTVYEDHKLDILDTIDRLSAELEAMAENKRVKMLAITRHLSRLHALKERQVVEYRYCYAMEWDDIAQIVFGEQTDVRQRLDWYKKRCTTIHCEAFVHLEELTEK